MTGQGNSSFEQIHRERAGAGINLSRTYRTANGHRVRALNFFQSRKRIIEGRVIEGMSRQVVKGQAQISGQWEEQIWEADGRHLLHDYLNLVEYREEPKTQNQLFA